MENQIGAFRHDMFARAIALDRCDHHLDCFLAELFGAMLDALVQKFTRIGPVPARGRAGIDNPGQVLNSKTAHRVVLGALSQKCLRLALTTYQRPDGAHGSSRIGSPARAMCSLACRMVNSPKWKIEAASTAVACPSRIPSTRWSRLPTPPAAITGTGTLSALARVHGRSKPCRVPSRSIDVSRISPAPSETTSW